jgi:exonuclease 3'-5' domain-containing protein 1
MADDTSESPRGDASPSTSSITPIDDPASLTSLLASVSLSETTSPAPILLDTIAECAKHLTVLIDRGDPVAVDFEGVSLSREGRLCLAQIASVDVTQPVFLVDVVKLGFDAFGKGKLGALLQSATIVKLIFGCRSDRDALFHQFGVTLQNVYDIQVVYCMRCDELAGFRVGRLKGLKAALGDCPGLDFQRRTEIVKVKQTGAAAYADAENGDAWEKRPLPHELIEYAAVDVQYLHLMYDEWKHFMKQGKMDTVVAKRKRKKGSARDF